MNCIRFWVSAVVLLVVLFSGSPSVQAESVLVATTNIYDAKILKQEGNAATVTFDISNRVGAQGQVRYGAYLMQGTSSERIASNVYDEILSLPEGDIIQREIQYRAPEYLTSGEYQLIIEAMTTEGLILAHRNVGTMVVTQTANVRSVQAECMRESGAALDAKSDANLINIQCTFVSDGEVKLIPQFATYKNTRYGSLLEQTEGTEISLTKGTTTQIVTATSVTVSGGYEMIVSFVDTASGIKYGGGSVYYKISGSYAIVTNAVFDKESYLAGESATLSVLWAESRKEPSAKTLGVAVSGALGECAPPQLTTLEPNNPTLSISIPLAADCDDPTATFTLYNEADEAIGSSIFGVTSKQSVTDSVEEQTPAENAGNGTGIKLLVMVLVLFIVLIAIFFIKHRSRTNLLAIAFIIFSAFSFAQEAQADTVIVRGWPFTVWLDNPVIHVPGYLATSENPMDYTYVNYVNAGPQTSVSNYYNGDFITEVFPMIEDVHMGITFTNGYFENTGPGSHFFNNFSCGGGPGITSTANFGGNVNSYVPPVTGNYSVTFKNAIRDYITDRWRPICSPVGSGPTSFNSPPDYEELVMDYKIVKDGWCDYPGLMCQLSFYCPSSYISNQSGGCIYGSKINASETTTSFTWQCTGSANGGNTESCVVRKPDAECGSANGGTFATAPSTNLCSKGTPTAVNDGSYWGWDCEGTYYKESCGASKDGGSCTPNNSACADNTCSTNTCWDGCSDIAGTMNCSCTPTNSACAASTCTTNTCWDGCNDIAGTLICGGGASCTANNLTRTWATNCSAIQNGTWVDGDTATVNDNDSSGNGYTGSVQFTCNDSVWSSPFNQSCNITPSPFSRLIVCPDNPSVITGSTVPLFAWYWANRATAPTCADTTEATASNQTNNANWIRTAAGATTATIGNTAGVNKGIVSGGTNAGTATFRASYLGIDANRAVTVSSGAELDFSLCPLGIEEEADSCDTARATWDLQAGTGNYQVYTTPPINIISTASTSSPAGSLFTLHYGNNTLFGSATGISLLTTTKFQDCKAGLFYHSAIGIKLCKAKPVLNITLPATDSVWIRPGITQNVTYTVTASYPVKCTHSGGNPSTSGESNIINSNPITFTVGPLTAAQVVRVTCEADTAPAIPASSVFKEKRINVLPVEKEI